MLLPSRDDVLMLNRRGPPDGGQSNGSKIAIIVVVSVVAVITISIISYIVLKHIRRRTENPKYIPTTYLKGKWAKWHPNGISTTKGSYSNRLQSANGSTTNSRNGRHGANGRDVEQGEIHGPATEENGVNRHQSIRSIITLPAYSRSLRENEQVIGREGDRGGIDVVIEAPETLDEEESRRDEEMESLYQIRLQRRRENEERTQRRQRRREARERGDAAELRRLRQESILRAEEREMRGAAALIADHQSRSRERRISSVSYAAVGVARHDGSRLRANSHESDSQPLMDSAASMGGSIRPWLTNETAFTHHRDRSATSLRSISDLEDSDAESQMPPFGRSVSDLEVVTLGGRSRAGSHAQTPRGGRSRAGSALARPSVDTADLAQPQLPAYDPPTYSVAGFEEAPPYEPPATDAISTSAQARTELSPPSHEQTSPSSGQADNAAGATVFGAAVNPSAPQLPSIGRLPSIRIADASPTQPRSPDDFS